MVGNGMDISVAFGPPVQAWLLKNSLFEQLWLLMNCLSVAMFKKTLGASLLTSA